MESKTQTKIMTQTTRDRIFDLIAEISTLVQEATGVTPNISVHAHDCPDEIYQAIARQEVTGPNARWKTIRVDRLDGVHYAELTFFKDLSHAEAVAS